MTAATSTTLAELLAARPMIVRTRKASGTDIMCQNRIKAASDGVEQNVSMDMFYSRGDNKGTPMGANDVRAYYSRKYSDELKRLGLVVHLISWTLDGNMLDESDHYCILALAADETDGETDGESDES